MERFLAKGLLTALCLSLFWIVASQGYAASKVPVITKEELKNKLGDHEVMIIDVRVEGAWKSSDHKIKGAVWEDPERVDSWAGKYPKDRAIVLYCS